MNTMMLVAIGGAAGAIVRYLITQLVRKETFPAATVIVNVVGSTILGFILASNPATEVVALIGIGFCGAMTTFSTFSYQTVMLIEDKHLKRAAFYAMGTLAFALGGFVLGWVLSGM